jgi:uncharacterized protein DUF1524
MRIRRKRWMAIAAAAAAALVWLHPGLGHDNATVAQSNAQPVAGDLAALLDHVQVVDSIAPVDGYDRGCGKGEGCVFGPAWNDPLDHSGCDTRNRILASSLRDVTFKPGTRNCKVITGYLDPDPYTGQRIALQDSQIDHIYPLARSWNAGAWKWDLRQRQIFANDLTELVAVSGAANRQKSDSGIDEWLPTYQPCVYVHRYLTVALKYQLPITTAERNATAAACPAAPPAAA